MSDDPVHDFTVAGAQQAAAERRLGEWVQGFLASDGSDNAPLGESLAEELASWVGPVRLAFDELHRLAGPPDQPTLTRLTDDDLERVDDMADSIDDDWEPPPLVVAIRDDQLVLEDGNHRTEGLRRVGETRYWAVVGAPGVGDAEAWLTQRIREA